VVEDFSGWSRAKELYELGVELEDNGELEAALEHYERAVAEDPAFGDAYVEMAYIQLRLGDERRAVENLRRAIRVAGHPLAYYNLGWIYEGRRRPERAEKLYRKAIAAKDDLLDAHLGLAAILMLRGAVGEAKAHVDRSAELGAEADYVRFLRESAMPRYAEFAEGLAAAAAGGPPPGAKERVYMDLGAILLGTAGDDGVRLPAETRRRFSRPAEAATTCGRFLEFCRHFRWSFDGTAPVDAAAEPLARFLAGALGIASWRSGEVPEERRVLLVAADLGDTREYFAALDSLENSRSSAFAFALALSPECFQDVDYRSLPQAVGMVTHAEPYWLSDAPAGAGEAADEGAGEGTGTGAGAAAEGPEEPPAAPDSELATAHINADFQNLWKPEPNAAEQLSWYELQHSHLNFPLRGLGKVRR